ncbi:DUF2934 domain-containing protein [Rhizobium leguminosarum]|uniref:DUF2934 domain-containing protein n=1 Tax=Rhizobium leguminosarum TaxID=384 RepID=UPI001AE207E9|nr:DUF2934 domain-containing protein [Rhizobium leguminosarum]MBP2449397.1 hypothetical protein [Rhizobium leguminosarum]
MENPARRKRKTSETKADGARPEFPSADARGLKRARQVANETDKQSGGSPAASREEQIRKRAYSLWEKGGRPEGQHRHHWTLAKHELDARGETGNPPNLAALREASREHTDAFLVKTDLEDADQREASPGTREQS